MPDISQPVATTTTSTELPAALRRDPLTGLFDQDYLSRELELRLAKSANEPIAATLALLQLENFYEIRSWVGRSEADLLLSDIAELLEKSLPDKVLLCRCQHYEFAVILFDECSRNARRITDQLKLALQTAVSTSIPPQLELKCGVGLATLDPSIASAEVLFARARHSLRLYHHRVRQDLSVSPATSKEAREILQNALRKRMLQLTFQPLVSLKQDGLKHYEVRTLMTAGAASLPTALLFETAVQNALGETIDRWVIDSVLARLDQCGDADLRMTISLTQNSMVSPQFFDWLGNALSRYQLHSEQLVMQISEIDVLIAQHHMDFICSKLNELNIRLTISNFGCTSDPFRYLPLLRAHFVKLDVSLLEKINVDPQKARQLANLVTELHENGLRVIAPSIETMTVLPLLWRCRVNFIQGYWLQQPEDTLEFEFLQEQTIA